jgi:hypothetical protein
MRSLNYPWTYALLELCLDDVCAKDLLEIRHDYLTDISSRSTEYGDFVLFRPCCEVDESDEFLGIWLSDWE